MIDLAQVARPLVLVDAAGTAAVQIAQLSGVLDRLPERARIGKHADRLADIAPERVDTHRQRQDRVQERRAEQDRKSTRLNSSHLVISYAVFCLKKKKKNESIFRTTKQKKEKSKRKK